MGDLHAALPTTGGGKLVKDLVKKGFGTDVEIGCALAEMLDRGEVKRNGKRWLAVETTVQLGNGMVVTVKPQSPRDPRYPVLCEALEDQGFSRYQGRVVRKQRRSRIDRVLSIHDSGD